MNANYQYPDIGYSQYAANQAPAIQAESCRDSVPVQGQTPPPQQTTAPPADSPIEESNEDPYMVQLSKPYKFEDQTFTEIDLTPLRDASTIVLLQAEKAWTVKGNVSMQMETNMAYCFEVAAAATGKPIRFFERLPKQDGVAVKAVVQQDFFGTME